MYASPHVSMSYFPDWSGDQIDYFAWNVRVVSVKKDAVLTIRRSDILSEACPIILIHLREAGNHLISSNECLSLWHSATFLRLIWYLELMILCEIWEYFR